MGICVSQTRLVSDEDDEVPLMAPGIISWRDAVKNSGTYSRLHVLLGILDSCIKWEKSSENAVSFNSGTYSRLHVLLGILDSCIKWEKSSENAVSFKF